MKPYKHEVQIIVELAKNVIVEAYDEDDACQRAIDMFEDGDFDLDVYADFNQVVADVVDIYEPDYDPSDRD